MQAEVTGFPFDITHKIFLSELGKTTPETYIGNIKAFRKLAVQDKVGQLRSISEQSRSPKFFDAGAQQGPRVHVRVSGHPVPLQSHNAGRQG